MDTRYDPHGVEARWQEAWEAEGLYRAGAGARRREKKRCKKKNKKQKK